VLNTGGAALDWFHASFCRELSDEQFYDEYVPGVLDAFLGDPGADGREGGLPTYQPYLGGSRYSLEPLTAGFAGLTLETTRDDLLLGLIRGNAAYLGAHLEQVGRLVDLGQRVGISGGGARVRGMLDARRRWTGAYEYVYQDQSSMLGAAMLGRIFQTGSLPGHDQVPLRRDKEAVS
jgi:sugar (pentulose or hexulose) kinase